MLKLSVTCSSAGKILGPRQKCPEQVQVTRSYLSTCLPWPQCLGSQLLAQNAQNRCRLLGVTCLNFHLGPKVLAIHIWHECPKQVQVTGSYLSAFPPWPQSLGCQGLPQGPKTGSGFWELPVRVSALAPKCWLSIIDPNSQSRC